MNERENQGENKGEGELGREKEIERKGFIEEEIGRAKDRERNEVYFIARFIHIRWGFKKLTSCNVCIVLDSLKKSLNFRKSVSEIPR